MIVAPILGIDHEPVKFQTQLPVHSIPQMKATVKQSTFEEIQLNFLSLGTWQQVLLRVSVAVVV